MRRLFRGLVLTQPFSLDCHHTLFFWSLTKVRKNKIIRLSRITCNNFKRFHLSSHPLQFLEICKRGNSQLVVYNSSTERFRKEYMNKVHAADVETSFFSPLFYGTNMINDDKSFHFIFIPCLLLKKVHRGN